MTKPENWYRQSAVIPYRLAPSADGDAPLVEILLITTRKRKRWIIPKGIVDPGLSALESALKEAYEEAGIRGSAPETPFGEYSYEKWRGVCRVEVFLCEVTDVLDAWPEDWARRREWVTADEAARRVREPELRELLRAVPQTLNQGG